MGTQAAKRKAGVTDGARTHDNRNHNQAINHSHPFELNKSSSKKVSNKTKNQHRCNPHKHWSYFAILDTFQVALD
jgi:hypothetical protein